MGYSTEAIVRHMITQNNHNINIAFPAVVVNTDNILDGLVDVQPLVNFQNPLTFETEINPVLYGIVLNSN